MREHEGGVGATRRSKEDPGHGRKTRDSAMALLQEDDAGPDLYGGMQAKPANAALLPMPTAVPRPPLR